MRKWMIFILVLFQGFTVWGASNRKDSLLLVLDKVVEEKQLYAEKRENHIDSLKTLLSGEENLEQRYYIYNKLYESYRYYNMYEALSVAEKTQIVATELKNKQLEYIAMMNRSEILGIMGMYKESLDLISKIDRAQLDKEQWGYYYHLHHALYMLLAENALSPKEKKQYEQNVSLYKDSLLLTVEENSMVYTFVKTGKLLEQERYDEALYLINQCYHEHGNNDGHSGILAYIYSETYAQKADIEKEKKYLAISAIADLRKGVKEYIALRQLAVLLYQGGDIDRAYRYVKCAMEDAAFCGARFRMFEISEVLPIIYAAYEQKVNREKDNLLKYLTVISLLLFVLAVGTLFIWRQMKKQSAAKTAMEYMYDDMKQMNENLDELNKKLLEANQVKEEYIGALFNLCSTYINKMESYRLNIHKKMKSNQTEKVKIITSSSLMAEEVKGFISNFDAIFLNIYPDFIDEFNALLTDEEQIIPKTGDILTPELRVYALIRLGITESSQIASLLHYSPQTVYNYKLKIKNKLAVSKEEFSVAIQQIGI